jgi:transcriptional regulator with XRE-family HTH domain
MTDKEQKEIFADNLLFYIRRSGKDQKQVAFDLDIKPTTLNQWVRGISLPSVATIKKIAEYFDIPFSMLVDRRGTSSTDMLVSFEEYELIVEYRNSDEDTKRMVKRLLAYYEGVKDMIKRKED